MRKTYLIVSAVVAFLVSYVFNPTSVLKFLGIPDAHFRLDFPLESSLDRIAMFSIIIFLSCTLCLLYYVFPRVKIGDIKLIKGITFGNAYGVKLVRYGFEVPCKVKMVILSENTEVEDIFVPLRTENQWEQEEYRESKSMPYTGAFYLAPGVPKVVPVFKIRKDESGQPVLITMHQNKQQWRGCSEGMYHVKVIVSHNGLWPSTKHFYFHFKDIGITPIRKSTYEIKEAWNPEIEKELKNRLGSL